MRILIFLLLIQAISSEEPKAFLDFWRDVDIFARQIQETIQDRILKNKFKRHYKRARKVAMYYNFEKCERNRPREKFLFEGHQFSNLTFDEKTGPAMNIVLLVRKIRNWKDNCALMPSDFNYFEIPSDVSFFYQAKKLIEFEHSRFVLSWLAHNDILQPAKMQVFRSKRKMSYLQAHAFCFLRKMWLIADDTDEKIKLVND